VGKLRNNDLVAIYLGVGVLLGVGLCGGGFCWGDRRNQLFLSVYWRFVTII
jgi:hypothetical protein